MRPVDRRVSRGGTLAHPVDADASSTDPRRVLAAVLSGILPGLGQAYNRRPRLAILLLAPALVILLLGVVALEIGSPARLLAWAIVPGTLRLLLALNLLVLGWRLFAVGNAFFDARFRAPVGRFGVVGLVAIVGFVILPHALLTVYGVAAMDSFGRIFTGDVDRGGPTTPEVAAPHLDDRLTILLIGVDSAPSRTTTLTDSLIVASVDPASRTATMMSVPRDLVNTPLGDGDTFAPKINSLLSYADRHPKEFPDGGTKTLQRAVATLLGVEIDYTATVDFVGFKKIVDIMGGVTIDNPKAIDDRDYYGETSRGFKLSKGVHMLDGSQALAYVRSRYSPGDTDFDRARRQQQVIVALRDRFVSQGSLLAIPAILEALGDSVRTDLPSPMLPELAALSEEIQPEAIVRVVMRSPMVHSGGKNNPYGSVQVPNVKLIREVAASAFPASGIPPAPWPTPRPTPAPATPTP